MPTNDERREVAARLRSVSGAPEWATTACCIAECLGEHDYPLWNDSKPLFNRLADLIEPEPERTCRVHIGEGTESGWWVCGSCGDLFDTLSSLACKRGRNSMPNYCPNCGAKVVGE